MDDIRARFEVHLGPCERNPISQEAKPYAFRINERVYIHVGHHGPEDPSECLEDVVNGKRYDIEWCWFWNAVLHECLEIVSEMEVVAHIQVRNQTSV